MLNEYKDQPTIKTMTLKIKLKEKLINQELYDEII